MCPEENRCTSISSAKVATGNRARARGRVSYSVGSNNGCCWQWMRTHPCLARGDKSLREASLASLWWPLSFEMIWERMASGLLQSLRGQKEPLLPSKALSEDGYTSDLETSPEMSFLNRPVPATANPIASDTHRRVEFRNDLRHHPDRGAGFYEYSRERYTRASLVSTGRHALCLR